MAHMKHLFRNIAAVLLGIIVGMSLIMVSGKVIPPPAGADVTTMDGLKTSMRTLGVKDGALL